MRIAILGNSGSGKSTLAHRLAVQFGLDTLDLDTLDLDSFAWEPGQIAVPRDPALARTEVAAFCAAHEHWVIEGCYAHLLQATLSASPLLLFLEPGVETCLAHCGQRRWEPHKSPSKAAQDEKLAFLLAWVRDDYSREGDLSLAAHQALFDGFMDLKHKLTDPIGPAFLEALAASMEAPS